MTVEVVPDRDGVVLGNGDLSNGNSNPGVASKKSRESERRRRRCKQKKNNKASQTQTDFANGTDGGDSDAGDDDANENANPQKVVEPVVVEYVPEKAELDDGMDEEFRKVFEKFSFQESVSEDVEKKDESALDADPKKKADSDSDEEEQDNQQKEKGGLSNKKKKLQRQ
ncbi:hypothetical protein SLA2020_363010 [Shorea laevis]